VLPQHIRPSVHVVQCSAIGSVSTNFRSTVLYERYQRYLIHLEGGDIRITETSTLKSTVQTT